MKSDVGAGGTWWSDSRLLLRQMCCGQKGPDGAKTPQSVQVAYRAVVGLLGSWQGAVWPGKRAVVTLSCGCAVPHGRVRDGEPPVSTTASAIYPWPPASGLAGQTPSRVLNTCRCTQERFWGLGLCLAKGYLALLFPTSTSLRERWPHMHPTGVPSLGSSELRQERGRSGAACADPSVSPRPVPCSGSGARRAS